MRPLNLPNALSVARICLVPVLGALLLSGDAWQAAAVFALGMGTDGLDGYIARTRDLVTDLGKLLDPIADKLFVGSAFICLVATERVEAWVVAVILIRELGVTGLRMLAKREGVVIAANGLGKAKTLVQALAVFALILAGDPYGLWVQAVVAVTVVITLVSALPYVSQVARQRFAAAPRPLGP